MNIETHELKNLIHEIATVTATAMRVELGGLSVSISQRQAFQSYGEGKVKRWIAQGSIKIRKDGNNTANCRINRIEIESMAKAEGITDTYIPKSLACKLYGVGITERWIAEGLIKAQRRGSKHFLDRLELDILANKNNRITYITTDERLGL